MGASSESPASNYLHDGLDPGDLGQLDWDPRRDAVITIDALGAIRSTNTLAEELIGSPLLEAPGVILMSRFRVINRATGRQLEDPAMRCLRTNRPVQLAEDDVLVRSDGMEIPAPEVILPIRTQNGDAMGVVMIFHDVERGKNSLHRTRCRLMQMPVQRFVNQREEYLRGP